MQDIQQYKKVYHECEANRHIFLMDFCLSEINWQNYVCVYIYTRTITYAR